MSTTKLTLAQKVANLNTPLTWDNIQNKPPFGTEANTILEGSKFIEGLGVNGYGGTIQDPGQKVAGKCYFDINTKSLFLCKTTNNLTSPNSDYFTSFDNKSLLNKLENLSNFKTEVYYSNPSGVRFTIFKYGKVVVIAAYTHGIERLTYGIYYKNKLPYNLHNTASSITGNNGSAGHMTLVDNTIMIASTDANKVLTNTFMGQLVAFEK